MASSTTSDAEIARSSHGPSGCGGERPSASLPLLDDVPHRLRRGASHLAARRRNKRQDIYEA
ncbi:MAG TPA: hypothetical protein VNL91_08190, partial [Thermoanaerobaculia bacterium]|nr:hypothetical protein [Thermoanaerobaculia bacterium]